MVSLSPLLLRFCCFEFFKVEVGREGFHFKGKPIFKDNNLQEELSYFCHKDSKFHFSSPIQHCLQPSFLFWVSFYFWGLTDLICKHGGPQFLRPWSTMGLFLIFNLLLKKATFSVWFLDCSWILGFKKISRKSSYPPSTQGKPHGNNQHQQLSTARSSRPEVFFKKGVLRNFSKFTGKHLYQGLFLIKLQT